MLLCGIIGHPLAHTLSPVLHNWGFATLGIQGSYHIWDTPPEKLSAFMAALRTLPIHGLSVTIPHKEAVMPLVGPAQRYRARHWGGSLENTPTRFLEDSSSGPPPWH